MLCLHVGASGAPSTSAVCHTSYDEDYLYVGAIVSSDQTSGTSATPFGSPLNDDAIGVSVGLPSEAGRAPRCVTMVASVAGGAQLYRGPAGAPLKGFEDFLSGPDGGRVPFKYHVTVNKAPAAPGYTAELAVPWTEIGGPPAPGAKLTFNIVLLRAGGVAASLAPSVVSKGEVFDPAKWFQVVMVEAAVASVAGSPTAKICARVFSVKPLIDGLLSEGEWTRVTAFPVSSADGGSVIPLPATMQNPRLKPAAELRSPLPCPVSGAPGPVALHPRKPQAIANLVMALYRMDWQCDPRKNAPGERAVAPDGSSTLQTHPLDGCGPWMTYDRVDWHRQELTRMRYAGIDVVLTEYRDPGAGAFRRGASALSAAMQWLAQARRDFPRAGLSIDLRSQPPRNVAGTAWSPAAVYSVVREFYSRVPRNLRALVHLSADNGGRGAAILVLNGIPLGESAETYRQVLRERFAAEYGDDIVVVGDTDGLDGRVGLVGADPVSFAGSGWLKSVVLDAGHRPSSGMAHPLFDRSPDDYRASWKRILSSSPDWVIVRSWNDYAAATEIAPTLEYGNVYTDLTNAYGHGLGGMVPIRAAFVAHDIPGTLIKGGTVQCSITVRNTGTSAWIPGSVALVWSTQIDGARSTDRLVPLVGPVAPGEIVSISVPIVCPTVSAPTCTVSVDMVQLGRKGDITAYFGAVGSVPLVVSASITTTGTTGTSPFSVLSSSLPTAVETGGSYNISLRIRNDSAKSWAPGVTRIVARLVRMSADGASPIDMRAADASAVVNEPVEPGSTAALSVKLHIADPDGMPFRTSAIDGAVYGVRWEVHPSASAAEASASRPEALDITGIDVGAAFFDDYTPNQLPGERRIPVRLALRNRGPQTWLKDGVKIGYHWYSQDGAELVWQDELSPLAGDVAPGAEAKDVNAWVTAPAHDGRYWLVWDVRVGDQWGSTQPSVRPYETRIHAVDIVNGRVRFVDLAKAYNSVVSQAVGGTASGGMDASGTFLPAETIPPFTEAHTAASALWLPLKRGPSGTNRQISFRWGPRGPGDPNAVQCSGQRISIAVPKKSAPAAFVHVLAVGARSGASAGFTLEFADGSQQYITFPTIAWSKPPEVRDTAAYATGFTRIRGNSKPGPPAYVYAYAIPVKDKRPPVAIVLPNEEGLKVLAVSVEK